MTMFLCIVFLAILSLVALITIPFVILWLISRALVSDTSFIKIVGIAVLACVTTAAVSMISGVGITTTALFGLVISQSLDIVVVGGITAIMFCIFLCIVSVLTKRVARAFKPVEVPKDTVTPAGEAV